MYKENYYSDHDRLGKNDDYVEPPSNKTLIVVQLTQHAPLTAKHVEGLHTLTEIFEHYKPSLDCSFQEIDGSIAKEKISFNSLEDFYPENIVDQSRSLKNLSLLQEELEKTTKNLLPNKIFANLLLNPEAKSSLIELFELLITELEY